MATKKLLSFTVTNADCFQITSHLLRDDGYCRLRAGGYYNYAHRHIYEECFGLIPEGLCVCHKCDNRSCINPEHLFLDTSAGNTQDKTLKGRQAKGENHGNAKLSVNDVKNIRLRWKPKDKQNSGYALAREFGVSPRSIRFIVTGRNWSWA